jgi:hypothetical protein
MVEKQVYDAAVKWSQSDAAVAPGVLHETKVRTDSGHTMITFRGEPRSWMDHFAGPVRLHVTGGILPGEGLQRG